MDKLIDQYLDSNQFYEALQALRSSVSRLNARNQASTLKKVFRKIHRSIDAQCELKSFDNLPATLKLLVKLWQDHPGQDNCVKEAQWRQLLKVYSESQCNNAVNEISTSYIEEKFKADKPIRFEFHLAMADIGTKAPSAVDSAAATNRHFVEASAISPEDDTVVIESYMEWLFNSILASIDPTDIEQQALCVTLPVLQLLSKRRLGEARKLLESAKSTRQNDELQHHYLLNFCHFLILSCDGGAPLVFDQVREKYAVAEQSAGDLFSPLLKEIRTLYFGQKAAPGINPMAQMFQSMFSQFGGAGAR